jgi:hypothetical protein
MPLKISRSTLICAVEVLENTINTHAKLTRLLLKFGIEVSEECDPGTLTDRFNHLIKFYDKNPTYTLDNGKTLAEELTINAATLIDIDISFESENSTQWKFLRSLDRDGLKIVDGNLQASLPDILDLPEADDDVNRLLKKHGFLTSKGHLDQALGAHGRGDWASANGQLRTFYEGLFDEIAIKIDASASMLASSENRRARLASLGFIDANLNEWGNDGKNFVNGLFKRLHPQGSHPGLSDQDDSTFRLHVVLLTARLFLLRFDKWPS